MLPEAFLISGGISLILVIVYHLFISTITFKKSKTIFSIILALVVFTLLIINNFIYLDKYPFILFCFVFPIQIISVQKFNSTLSNYFPGKQIVRFSGILSNSREFGFIIMGYTLPLLMLTGLNLKYLYFVCILAYAFYVTFEMLFINSARNKKMEQDMKSFKFIQVVTHRFSGQLILFVLLSALIGYLIHFAFLTITNENFESTVGLIKFFGLFMGTMLLFNFLADKFLLNRILNNLGLPYSIVLSPIFTGSFIIIALVVGWRLGLSQRFSSGFMFFFLFVSAGKFIEKLFKYAVENPSSNILLTSLKTIDHVGLKEFLQGPVQSLALLLSGVILYAKSFVKDFNLIYLSVLIASISVIWFWVSVRMIKRYRNNLKLRFAEIGMERSVKNYLSLPEKNENIVFSNFQETNDEKSLYILKMLKIVSPAAYFKYLLNYLNPHRKDTLLANILAEIGRYDLTQALPMLDEFRNIKNHDIQYQVKKLKEYMESDTGVDYSFDQIVDIIYSSRILRKKKIFRVLAEKKDDDINKLLPILIKDIEPDIVYKSIILARNLKVETCLEIITGYLLSDQYYAFAYDVLIDFGDISISYLDELYYGDNVNQKVKIRIIRLLGDIRSNLVISSLLEKLDDINATIKKEVILSLRKHNFKATNEDANIIMRQIIRAVEICSWNMSVQLQFRKFEKNDSILFALNKELNENYLYIFGLLTLLYDHKKLNYIYNQIAEGNSEILAYAVEMLDFILDEDLKNILFPLFEHSSYNVKINQLQYYFPIELSKKEANLKKVINRENNYLSVWTKTCAIYYCNENTQFHLINELISSMFHPTRIIRETAAYILYKHHNDQFNSAYKRLKAEYAADIDLSMQFLKLSEGHLIYNRVLFLKTHYDVFNVIPDDQLVEFVSAFQHFYLEKGETFNIPDEEHAPLVWVFNGKININTKLSVIYQLTEGNITDLTGVPFIQNITAKENSMLYILNKTRLNELLFDNKELLEAILQFMDKNKIFNEEVLRSHYENVLI